MSDPRADRGTPEYRRALIALFCAGLATFAQMYSPQGLLPQIAREFETGAGSISWIIGATTIGVALGVLPWARLSDHLGRITTIRWAAAAAMILGLLVPFAPNFETMIVLRGIEGIALGGLPALAVTTLAETVSPRSLGAAVGGYVAGTTFGGLIGRVVAGSLADPVSWRFGLAAVALLAAAATIAFIVLIPKTAVPLPRTTPLPRALLANLRNPAVLVLVLQAFLLMGGFVAAYNMLAFRLEQDPYALSTLQISWLFLAYLAGAVASNLVWRIARRIAPVAVMLASLTVMLLGLLLTLTEPLAAIVVGLVLFTGGFFGAHSIASGLIGRRTAGLSGASQAPPLYNLAYYAGSSVLGWVGGLAFVAAGWAGTVAMVAAAILISGTLEWVQAKSRGGIGSVDA
ncbi:MFS transporter [Leucobacter viscericola]|uniref:MFS transporter n=1 Tax=Leucobacter viscericola TaxID=2714935 RepID=A0A6G7XF63_9MICO|nr:MFS transporter [Leucobacter viscericola]QIK63037.1 MFS transporter [Leucobacter viscericola]